MTAKATRVECFVLKHDETSYEIQVSFKKMKTVRLRVVTGGQIRLSAPLGTDRKWLEKFVTDRADWIAANVEKMKSRQQMQIGEDAEDSAAKRKPLTAAERKDALAYLMPMVEKWYPVVETFGVSMPHVTVRRMTTRYGTCSVGRGRITLASMLLEVPKESAEYVVFHELVHFLYPNHGKAFYQFIETYMPDWKERKQGLKSIIDKT